MAVTAVRRALQDVMCRRRPCAVGAGAITTTLLSVLVEAPGSQSFEMTDIPAIVEVAHARGALVIDDNTIPFDCDPYRTATKWSPGGPMLRLRIGLENVDDLKADRDRGFAALKAVV